jgi:hypothetical protein
MATQKLIMRTTKYLIPIMALFLSLAGCEKETYDDVAFAQAGNSPEQLSAMFEITQDNTGMVTITPNGSGAISYDVFFGDNTTAPVKVAAGKNTTHKYAEGVYTVKLVGYGVNGKTTEATQQLTVSFRAPEALEFTVAVDPANSMKVSVTAKAIYETNFKVYFGDVANEMPVTFLEGETVTHTYAAVGNYEVKVVAQSGGAATTELKKTVAIVNPVLLPVTFESATLNYEWINFDGGGVTIIDNPQKGGINTSNKVARMIKSGGQPWGGSVMALGAPIDFSANKIFRMKVFSPRVGAKVLLKVENISDGGINFEKEVATTKANEWEDLVFDFSAINTANSYHKIVLIFDNGTMGNGTANFTFLFDDIRLTNVLPSNLVALPITFENPNANYAFTDFGGNITTDDVDPLSASNKVKKTTKPSGAQTWAGVTMGQLAGPIPFTASNTKMSVRVYSPAAGLTVLLKAEDKANSAKSVETQTVTTVANGWETLEFNFSNNSSGTPALNLANNYDMLSIFFDFGNAGSGKVFYWDDVTFVTAAPATLSLPLSFESATLDYAFTNFDGGNVTIVNNPQSGGINTSAKVARMVKGAGQTWGGSFITLDAPINFATQKIVKMKVFSPRVGAKVLLKVENLTDGGISFEKEVTTTVANAWEDLTFDYSAINIANSYQKVVLIFDNGTAGDGTANYTFLFDDIRLN